MEDSVLAIFKRLRIANFVASVFYPTPFTPIKKRGKNRAFSIHDIQRI